MTKLEVLLKNMDYKYPIRNAPVLEKELQYMGNTILIKGRRVCVKPLKK